MAERDVSELLHMRTGIDEAQDRQRVRLCGVDRDNILAMVHVQVGATSQFIVLRGWLSDSASLALDLETRRFHDGAGPLVDCDLREDGIWAAWEGEAAYSALDSTGLQGVQWATDAGEGLCSVVGGPGTSAIIVKADGGVNLMCRADCVALLPLADADEQLAAMEPVVLGTRLARGHTDVAALRKAVRAVRRAVDDLALANVDVEVAAGSCAAAACRRAVGDKARQLASDAARCVAQGLCGCASRQSHVDTHHSDMGITGVAMHSTRVDVHCSDMDNIVVAMVHALEAMETPGLDQSEAIQPGRQAVAIEAGYLIQAYWAFVRDLILAALLIASHPTVAVCPRSTLPSLCIVLTDLSSAAWNGAASVAPYSSAGGAAAARAGCDCLCRRAGPAC